VGLKLKGAHQLLVYADDMNLLVDNIYTIKENAQTLIDASKEAELNANTENSKYVLLSRHQNAGQKHDMKIAYRSLEKCGIDQIFWNDSNKSVFDSGRN
jgi:hypothetical protein